MFYAQGLRKEIYFNAVENFDIYGRTWNMGEFRGKIYIT
jgi:hypothetical protein